MGILPSKRALSIVGDDPVKTGSSPTRLKSRSVRIAIAALLVGCRTWPDSWQERPVATGKAWFNESCQQTAFDTNGDGKIDVLRFWIGSGAARELHDNDLDGWFDDLVYLSYEKERGRVHQHVEAPAVPVTGSSGAFKRPE